MTKLSEFLEALITKSDDLSTLPQLVAAAKLMEENDAKQAETIGKLQETSRKYLSMIPIPGTDPKPATDDKPLPSLNELAASMVQEMFNGGN